MSADVPTLVACNTEHHCLRFWIHAMPSPGDQPRYIAELKEHGVSHLVRACAYSEGANQPVEAAGIKVHNCQFPDGNPPPEKILSVWGDIVRRVCRLPDEAIAARAQAKSGDPSVPPLGVVQDPDMYPVCPITRLACTAVKIEESEPISKPKCSACKQFPKGSSMWRCEQSGFTLCRECKDRPYSTHVIWIGEETDRQPKKGTIDETLQINLDGTTVIKLEPGGAGETLGLVRGMNVRRIGDHTLWTTNSRKDVDQAFAAQPQPFTITFQLDHVPPCIGIHCLAGLGRAPVLVAVALMTHHGIDGAEVIDYIRKRRPHCYNTDQLHWLMQYGRKRQRCCTVM